VKGGVGPDASHDGDVRRWPHVPSRPVPSRPSWCFHLCVAGWRDYASLPLRVSQDVDCCAPGLCKPDKDDPGPGYWNLGPHEFLNQSVAEQQPDLIFSLNTGFHCDLAKVLDVRALGAAAVGAVAGRRGRVLYKTTTAPRRALKVVKDEAVLSALNGTGVEVFDAFGMTLPVRQLEEEHGGGFYWDDRHFTNQVRATRDLMQSPHCLTLDRG
jgi:hypothetical protein